MIKLLFEYPMYMTEKDLTQIIKIFISQFDTSDFFYNMSKISDDNYKEFIIKFNFSKNIVNSPKMTIDFQLPL